jgi:hypothetical protein
MADLNALNCLQLYKYGNNETEQHSGVVHIQRWRLESKGTDTLHLRTNLQENRLIEAFEESCCAVFKLETAAQKVSERKYYALLFESSTKLLEEISMTQICQSLSPATI